VVEEGKGTPAPRFSSKNLRSSHPGPKKEQNPLKSGTRGRKKKKVCTFFSRGRRQCGEKKRANTKRPSQRPPRLFFLGRGCQKRGEGGKKKKKKKKAGPAKPVAEGTHQGKCPKTNAVGRRGLGRGLWGKKEPLPNATKGKGAIKRGAPGEVDNLFFVEKIALQCSRKK